MKKIYFAIFGLIIIFFIAVGTVTGEYQHFLFLFYKEQGNLTINKIVENTAEYDSDPTRLSHIADLIVQDFTDPYFPNQRNSEFFCYYGDDNWGWCAPPILGYFNNNPFAYKFAYDKLGRCRAMNAPEFSFNPYWIAYQRTGACQDLSVIFNTTANRAGFPTRIVRADGIGHWWNEVLIDEEWKYFDTQNYGIENKTNSKFWFGNRSEYAIYSGFNRCNITECGVYVFNSLESPYGEEITYAYDPTGECIHGSYDSVGCQS